MGAQTQSFRKNKVLFMDHIFEAVQTHFGWGFAREKSSHTPIGRGTPYITREFTRKFPLQ
jgi:hypothetical protein